MIAHGKTKIVCTLGPSSNSVDMLVRLINSGMDVARLNFSHGSYDDHLRSLDNIREAVRRTGEEVAILQDLRGPKIRIGDVGAPFIELKPGGPFTITTRNVPGNPGLVSTTYQNLVRDVHPGDRILLDDGKLRLLVHEVKGEDVFCEVVVGGALSSNKGINLPGVAVSAPSFTDKDLQDLEFGLKNGVDYVALSFVSTAEDIKSLRTVIVGKIKEGRYLPIVAKIERHQAVANIDEIIQEADGVMIARGDLGVELPPEDVPIHQKIIIKKCNQAGKPVIIATQMLESMINSPTPTRAETNDVANAVIDGGDCVMLSGETSVGKYPLESVQIMDRIIRKVESEYMTSVRVLDRPLGSVESRLDALGRAACVLAEQMNAAAIVMVTHSGQTARGIARYRPRPAIIAITDRPKILRRLQLIWGVRGIVIEDLDQDSDKALDRIQEHLLQSGMILRGEYIVMLGGQPFYTRGSTNFIKVEKVE